MVCDNLKAGVTATCRYEPGINRTYQDLATHYDTAILPTRPRKPRDKAKVEVGVLIVERYVLARLRKTRFFAMREIVVATAIRNRLLQHSQHPHCTNGGMHCVHLALIRTPRRPQNTSSPLPRGQNTDQRPPSPDKFLISFVGILSVSG